MESSCHWLSQYTSQDLWNEHKNAQLWLESKKLPPDINSFGVFCNYQADLKEVDVYGFDYDYTLAAYKTGVEYLIHDIAKELLVEKCGYPKAVGKIVYDRKFAIRGLHYDVEKGLFLKVDSSHQIQLGTVYRGKQKLSNKEVLDLYRMHHLTVDRPDQVQPLNEVLKMNLVQLADIFSKPEMSLLAEVIELFTQIGLEYEPQSLHHDVKKCIGLAHSTFHRETKANPGLFLHRDPDLVPFLERFAREGKEVFLITNSPFDTVDAGMSFMVGPTWRELFEVIIVQAGKPHFFTNTAQPFRELDVERNVYMWDKVTRLDKGKIYAGGTIAGFQELTGWRGGRVMYFGDHPYADLADVTLRHGWRTAAVIRELEQEIDLMNSDEFKWGVNWQQVLISLIEDYQDQVEDGEGKEVVEAWKKELEQSRVELRTMFNPQFGSVFRSHNNPTYFSRKLFRFSDIYMSRVTNLLSYSLSRSFYARRGALPHEFKSRFV